jgi:hypothetical protein
VNVLDLRHGPPARLTAAAAVLELRSIYPRCMDAVGIEFQLLALCDFCDVNVVDANGSIIDIA